LPSRPERNPAERALDSQSATNPVQCADQGRLSRSAQATSEAVRLSRALCTVVGEVISGSHATLDALFLSAGAPGEPPALAHHSKWKEWLFRAGQDPSVDSLAVLGSVLEEFMDIPPEEGTPEFDAWKEKRERVEGALEENGLRYYRFGRVLPQRETAQTIRSATRSDVPLRQHAGNEIPTRSQSHRIIKGSAPWRG